jgi:transposase-like protein
VDQGQSQAAVARKYELSPHLIPLWKKALSTGRLGGEATGGPSVETLLQDQRIKAEMIQEQAQEIHLLKKALATFSSSPSSSGASSAAIGPQSSRSRKPAR